MTNFTARVVLLIAFLGLTLPVAAQQDIVSIGDSSLRLPPPRGYVMVPPSSSAFVEGERWTIPSNRLIALYLPSIKSPDAKPQYMRRVVVMSYRKAESATVSAKDFQNLRAQFRTSNQTLINTATGNARKYQPSGRENLATAARSLELGEVRLLEMFNEQSEWSVSMLMLVKYTMEVEGRSVEVPTVMSSTPFLLRGKICMLHVYSALDAPNAIGWVKSQTKEWLATAHSSNR